MSYRVLIAGEGELAGELSGILNTEGYTEVGHAPDSRALLEMAESLVPEVIVVDINLPGGDALEAAKQALLKRPVPIVMVAAYSQADRVKKADEMGVSAHLFRPVTKESLINAIELGVSRFRQCQALHMELGDCKEALRVRKLVEKAKGILMKRNSLNEEEAYLRIQKLSRDKNISMEKVAESIITASKLI